MQAARIALRMQKKDLIQESRHLRTINALGKQIKNSKSLQQLVPILKNYWRPSQPTRRAAKWQFGTEKRSENECITQRSMFHTDFWHRHVITAGYGGLSTPQSFW